MTLAFPLQQAAFPTVLSSRARFGRKAADLMSARMMARATTFGDQPAPGDWVVMPNGERRQLATTEQHAKLTDPTDPRPRGWLEADGSWSYGGEPRHGGFLIDMLRPTGHTVPTIAYTWDPESARLDEVHGVVCTREWTFRPGRRHL